MMLKAVALLLLLCGPTAAQAPSTGLQEPRYQYPASGVDPHQLRSDERVKVTEGPDAWRFEPSQGLRPGALMFLPGASVEASAYAPLCRAIAHSGHRVLLIKLPPPSQPLEAHKSESLARVKAILAAEPKGSRWVLAGHSLGGAMAAQFAFEQPGLLAGLILIGTTHPNKSDLSALPLDITKVYGTLDGVAREDQVLRFGSLLPKATHWVPIKGGNHAQFGSYGGQRGDGEATIPAAEQQAITLQAVLASLQRANPREPLG